MAGNFDPKTFTIKPFQIKVDKPWGYEIIFSPLIAPAVGKILFVKKGARLSLQWHDKKTETLCLLKGKAKLLMENEQRELSEIRMEIEKGYFMNPGQTHRIQALEDCLIIESSTPETGNTIRVEDDFFRPTETEEMREQERKQQ